MFGRIWVVSPCLKGSFSVSVSILFRSVLVINEQAFALKANVKKYSQLAYKLLLDCLFSIYIHTYICTFMCVYIIYMLKQTYMNKQ